MTDKLPMLIAVRGYAIPAHDENDKSEKKKPKHGRRLRKALLKPTDEAVVFDTETTTDHTQRLRIGTYQVRKGVDLKERGLFYEPDNVSKAELSLLTRYAKKRQLHLRTRESFVRQVLYHYGYDRGGLILGFNLPFDLSRLATRITTSHGKDMRGGFSLELLPEKWRPNILVKHLNSRMAFMRFAAHAGPVDARSMRKKGFKTQARTGYFQDVKTLAAALLGRSFKLGALADHLQTAHRKLGTDEHGGPLTKEYLDYAVADVDVTWDCYAALKKVYAGHGLNGTPPHRIYSEASLGKAYFREMGVEPWTKLQPDFDPVLLGIIMSTYYGGRSEVRIRRKRVRVLYCDFRSMYPTVCTLMGLWRYVIATGINCEDWTADAIALLNKVKLEDLARKEFWPTLTTLVQVLPDDDVLPVRASYSGENRTIGLNHLSAEFGLWYTLADCIASKLHTGKPPKVVRAIRFAPKERQTGLKPINIGGNKEFRIDPSIEGFDFYKRVIELRGQIQAKHKKAKADGREHEAEVFDSTQLMLKLLANSTSYGIFAEMNVQSHDRPRQVICHGGEEAEFQVGSRSVEEAGTNFHPLIATLITGAARLMLSLAECLAKDQGLGWALCDTDSLALARPGGLDDAEFLERGLAVTSWFDAINPYDDCKPLFKVEDQNFRTADSKTLSGQHEPLFVLAISAKRYALFNLDGQGRPIIRKAVAHGLGHLLPPYKDSEAPPSIPAPAISLHEIGVERWQYDFWHQIIMAELDGHPNHVDVSAMPQLNRPAASRYSASTPALLHWFDRFNARRDPEEQVRAFNFMLAYHVSRPALYRAIAEGCVDVGLVDGGLSTAIAPYDDDRMAAAHRCFDRRTGQSIPVIALGTYHEAIGDYHLHSESKFENGELTEQGSTARRHIEALAVEFIGKEANRWEEQFYLGESHDAQIEYGMSASGLEHLIRVVRIMADMYSRTALAETAGISRQQLAEVLAKGSRPRAQTIKSLFRAIWDLEVEYRRRHQDTAVGVSRLRHWVSYTGLTRAAEQLRIDPSNLGKVLSGTRGAPISLLRRFELIAPRGALPPALGGP